MDRRIRRTGSGLLVAAMTAGSLAVASPVASAAGGEGDPCSTRYAKKNVVYSPSKYKQITHATVVENFTGSTATREVYTQLRARAQAQVTRAEAIGGGLEASLFKIFTVKVDGKYDETVAKLGSMTQSTSLKVKWTMKSGDRYVFYSGVQRYRSSWKRLICDWAPAPRTGFTWWKINYGWARSYNVRISGGVGCKQYPSSSTMAYLAKKKYC